jgi:hypothetical protein
MYLFALLHMRQKMMTMTKSVMQTDDMDRKAICSGCSGSHQNWNNNATAAENLTY